MPRPNSLAGSLTKEKLHHDFWALAPLAAQTTGDSMTARNSLSPDVDHLSFAGRSAVSGNP
jgi:hypothetical protein